MKNQTNIEKLITTGRNVFTIDDLAVIWRVSDRKKLVERVKYYLRAGRLASVHKGVYAYGDYSSLDVAQKLVPLSYLSLYTTAQMHGLAFQHYSTVFSMSLRSKRYKVAEQQYQYHGLKSEVFYNSLGLSKQDGRTIAGRERTICDLLYVNPKMVFDNLHGVDIDLLRDVSRIYGNKRLEREVQQLIKLMKEE